LPTFSAPRLQWTPPANDNLRPLARRLATLTLGALVVTALALLALGLAV
jgi:hypothetical protein